MGSDNDGLFMDKQTPEAAKTLVYKPVGLDENLAGQTSPEDFDELCDENTSLTEADEPVCSGPQEHEDLEEYLEDHYEVNAMYLVDASSIKQNQPITPGTIRFMPGHALKVEGVDYITVSEDNFYEYVQEGDQTADTLARYFNALYRAT